MGGGSRHPQLLLRTSAVTLHAAITPCSPSPDFRAALSAAVVPAELSLPAPCLTAAHRTRSTTDLDLDSPLSPPVELKVTPSQRLCPHPRQLTAPWRAAIPYCCTALRPSCPRSRPRRCTRSGWRCSAHSCSAGNPSCICGCLRERGAVSVGGLPATWDPSTEEKLHKQGEEMDSWI